MSAPSNNNSRGDGKKGLTRYQAQQKGKRSMNMGQSERRLQGSRETADRERLRLEGYLECVMIPILAISRQ